VPPPVEEPTLEECATAPIDVPVAPMTRLTAPQYLESAREILARPAATALLAETQGPIVSAREVELLADAATKLVALGGHRRDVPCSLDGGHDEACARGFIETFAARAFRRPLSAEEVTWLSGVYTSLRDDATVSPAFTFAEAIDAVAEVVLQSPQFLYRPEFGRQDPALPAGLLRLTGHELATRLSYTLWDSTPDRELLEAAASGALDSEAGVRAQAERLLADPRARPAIRRFASAWLDLDKTNLHPALELLQKDAARFPDDSPALRQSMRTESEALYERAFFRGPQGFSWLMTTTEAYVDGPLGELYEVEGGPTTAGDHRWVQLDPSRRAGLFTRAAFLTQQASDDYQSPIRRGVHLIRKVMCWEMGDPPPNSNNTPAVPDSNGPLRSVRQVTDARTSGDSCMSCHALINPIGYTLENYDALGAWQTHDTGVTAGGEPFTVPVDPSAEIVGTDLEGLIDGPLELSTRLATSEGAHDCMTERWFVRALGRAPAAQDACTVVRAQESFRTTGDLQALVVDLLASPAALHLRRAP
jgi:hypothetical protein